MTEDEKKGVAAIVGLLMLPFSILLYAFVIAQMWEWFIVPLGVLALGKAHAYGIAMMFRYAVSTSSKSDKGKTFANIVMASFIYAGLTLLTGYICHRIMVG